MRTRYATIFLFALAVSAAFVARAQAATLYFDPASQAVGAGDEFKMAVLIDAATKANAFEVTVLIPSDLELVDASDGDSVINLWIQRPTFDERFGTLTFAGVVPGSYSGKAGRLTVLTLRAKQNGEYRLSFDPKSRVLLSGPVPVADALSLQSADVLSEAGKLHIENNIPDTDPPESFSPFVATSSLIYGGGEALYFETQDKGSGMAGYELAGADMLTRDMKALSWKSVTSPYPVSEYDTSRYIYIRATDKKGNYRVEYLAPSTHGGWSPESAWAIILFIALIIALLCPRLISRRKAR